MRSQEKHRLVLCSAEELREGERRLFEVDGVEIGLIRAEGTCYAFRNSCPHQGVPMLYGSVVGTMLPSEPQEYVYGLHNEIIRCPLHGWEFNLKTGKALFSPQVSIKMYDAKEEDDEIVLYLDREPQRIVQKQFACAL
ncbi:Rieske (2Fe-2S) protein [Brevibacillus centrosporus]|uniref:Ferredoxin subunit of nitrite reductase or a ring-hydroxylating dioxygenase n=1 Tax=Brevibacillus centrosporus TaxID=54910 RepID=A0A1I4C380_9BACL|nr:Rieske (2Fe-2S) protein [Brevibacillus centrosporus]MED4907622.1 Rieske (2Fe-2S) protein [Brevibacillus centrosporus]SFK74789.1 Ferredoxin subunit of nitrite reductase or a ring-hydroxylating dioxygenase [Brevibacillus centrosporus]